MTRIDQRVAAIAAKQYDAFSREQAFRVGATDRMVTRRVQAGDWLRPEPAVYTLAGRPRTWLQWCKVAELSCPGAAIAGPAAAALHGLDGYGQCRPEIVVPANANCRTSIAIAHRYSGAKLTTVKGIRVTTVAQTLYDLCIGGSPLRVERALDGALASKLVTLAELQERSEHYRARRRRGTPVMDSLLAERSADGWEPPSTALESALYAVLGRLPSQPTVVRQADVPWWASQPGRVDAILPASRIIVEADGRRWHTRVADFERDRWRDNLAAAHGYRVLRFTWLHLHEFVDDVIELVEQSMAVEASA